MAKLDDVKRSRIRKALSTEFGDRLRDVVLYGSEARGSSTADSDVDIFVVLAGPVFLGRDLKAVIRALYPIQLEIIRPIHAMPVDEAVFSAGEFAIYRAARSEGVRI